MAHPRGNAVSQAAPPQWHRLSVDETVSQLGTSTADGLSAAESSARLTRFGTNELREGKRRGALRMLLDEFTDFMILVLIAAAVIAGAVGEPADAIAIIVIVLLNGVVGFVQEFRAERAMAALKKLGASTAKAVRGGRMVEIPAAQLVPGDLVLLETGGAVPADLRIAEAAALQTDEAALTGESVPVPKQTGALSDPALAVAERSNLAFKGTTVTYGRGRGIVVASGMQTELGRIAELLSGQEDSSTPLQKRLEHLGRRLALAALAICAVVFVFGILRGEPPMLMFLTAVSLAVAAIPEALPAVVTVSLALGAHKMASQNALIRRLSAVETLGSVSYICTDKTGTLTQNRMHVEELCAEPDDQPLLLQAMALNNDATQGEHGKSIGDPTEVALLRAAAERGYAKQALEARMPRVAELPFDSERKCMTTFHRDGTRTLAFTKGAPEQLLERCRAPLDQASIHAQAERMAKEGLRVIAFAWREWPAPLPPLQPLEAESALQLLGLVGMMDPPRPEAGAAVARCRAAGISPVMVTGDHPVTANAIAERLGLLEPGMQTLTGKELARLGDDQLAARVREVRVYARVDPAQKIRIVEALQTKGEYVAMTGDGVNDAPALKRAEIGVAMGKIGTDVAREASDMVLLDDNFATIVDAVAEGRRIYDNIRKFIRFVMTGNVGEIVTIFFAPFLGLPLALLPIQILWINLVTDGLPGLALALERAEPSAMRRPPRPPGESVFARGLGRQIVWTGLLVGALSIGAQAYSYHGKSPNWQTIAFTVLTFCQMFVAFGVRSERESLFRIGWASNPPLLGAVLLTFALQLAIIYTPALQGIFKTQPLAWHELGLCVALSCLVLVAMEAEKALVRRSTLRAGAGSR